jgi:lysophospholipase L1-like esterase
VPNDEAYFADGLHLNNEGAKLLARWLRDRLAVRLPRTPNL